MLTGDISAHTGLKKYGYTINEDPLAVIYNKTQWKLCTVSALHNFEYDAVKFKQYASLIKQKIVSTVATRNSSLTYSVKIDVGNYLKYCEEDSNAIIIQVFTMRTENPTNVYEAILCSWGVSESVPNSVHLPYLIDRGQQNLATVVRNTLSTLFDCTIKQLCLSQNFLLYVGFECIENAVANANNRIINLNFTIPKSAQKDKITVQFEIGDLQLMLAAASEEDSKKSERVKLAYQLILNHVYHACYSLNLTVLELNEIVLPTASIKNNGVIKMKTPEMVNCIFTGLNEISNMI